MEEAERKKEKKREKSPLLAAEQQMAHFTPACHTRTEQWHSATVEDRNETGSNFSFSSLATSVAFLLGNGYYFDLQVAAGEINSFRQAKPKCPSQRWVN